MLSQIFQEYIARGLIIRGICQDKLDSLIKFGLLLVIIMLKLIMSSFFPLHLLLHLVYLELAEECVQTMDLKRVDEHHAIAYLDFETPSASLERRRSTG